MLRTQDLRLRETLSSMTDHSVPTTFRSLYNIDISILLLKEERLDSWVSWSKTKLIIYHLIVLRLGFLYSDNTPQRIKFCLITHCSHLLGIKEFHLFVNMTVFFSVTWYLSINDVRMGVFWNRTCLHWEFLKCFWLNLLRITVKL